VLWGERDTFVPIDVGQAVTAALPHSTFEAVPDAGHCIHIELPELVAERISSTATDPP
jgi:pimeloyl-ACP methyl ester carboxylesterase